MFQKVAVLGSGVMGAQIAAHFSNLGLEVVLFDLGPENTLVLSALKALKNMKPAPLVLPGYADRIRPANYETDLHLLSDCDFVLEVIAERLIWKQRLYSQIQNHLSDKTILASNTSGLQIEQLAEVLTPDLRKRFCGVHFFNPPRYMSLVELVAHPQTRPDILDQLEAFLVHSLGKNVVRTQDTPNFIANRVGVFSMLATIYHTEKFGLGIEVVDTLTGPLIGRSKSATFRTADVVGLDTFVHVVQTMTDHLRTDPWSSFFKLPDWLRSLVERGALGQKTQVGVYKKDKDKRLVFDFKISEYRPALGKPSPAILDVLKMKDPVEKFSSLINSNTADAQFMWSIFRDVFHYAAYHLQEIAYQVSDLDLAIRWGFGWEEGIFETWQKAGWSRIAEQLQEDIQAGKTLSQAPLPSWVTDLKNGPYVAQGNYSPQKKSFVSRFRSHSRKIHDLYQKQLFPDPILNEYTDEGKTVLETDAVRLWSRSDDVAILNFKTKMNSISVEVLDGVQSSLERVGREFGALILWQRHGVNFSVGANLKLFLKIIQQKRWDEMDQVLNQFQHTCLGLRRSPFPVIAAVRGYVFGGGCEMMLYCDRVVAALESYIGLVESGVGVLPAGGGCTEMARRADVLSSAYPVELDKLLNVYWGQIAMGKASSSAHEAQAMGYLRSTDRIVAHPHELLWAAHEVARLEMHLGYVPAQKTPIRVGGHSSWANLKGVIANWAVGQFGSAHDARIADIQGRVLCGSDVESGALLDEEVLFTLEREGFIELVQAPETVARIQYMLETGKPLRN